MSVVYMVNNTTSKCRNCMILIRMLVLHCFTHNVKLKVKYISSQKNLYPDLLSRLKYKKFRSEARRAGQSFNKNSENIPDCLWPLEKIWFEEIFA